MKNQSMRNYQLKYNLVITHKYFIIKSILWLKAVVYSNISYYGKRQTLQRKWRAITMHVVAYLYHISKHSSL